MNEQVVKVGVGVFIFKQGKFLMGLRHGSHGADRWSLPGGHLEFGETFEEATRREVLEETNLTIKNVRFGAITNDHFKDDCRHYVSIWMLSDWESGQEIARETDKLTDFRWVDFGNLPSPLFQSWEQFFNSPFLEQIKPELAGS